MRQRTAVLLSTALTAFIIVVTLGVAGATSLRSQESTSAQPATDAAASDISAIPEIPATATAVAATPTPQTPEVAAQPVDAQQFPVKPELVSYQGTPAYEIKYDGGVMYVDARTGDILYDTRLDAIFAQLQSQVSAGQSADGTASPLVFESDEDHGRD